MSCSMLMVNLELGRTNTGVLRVARDLARRFGAAVTGIAACQPAHIIYNDGCYVPVEAIEARRREIETEMQEAEREFRKTLTESRLVWRSAMVLEPPSDYVAREARGADLVLTGMMPRTPADPERVVTRDIVMQAGRPVLVVPAAATGLALQHVMLGWTDTRETRRAARDALPLLRAAARVSVVAITAGADLAGARLRLADVARWLDGHGVRADTHAVPSLDGDACQLDVLAGELGADLIVAGAYGHGRMREWALGGVTRDLLLRGQRCALVAH